MLLDDINSVHEQIKSLGLQGVFSPRLQPNYERVYTLEVATSGQLVSIANQEVDNNFNIVTHFGLFSLKPDLLYLRGLINKFLINSTEVVHDNATPAGRFVIAAENTPDSKLYPLPRPISRGSGRLEFSYQDINTVGTTFTPYTVYVYLAGFRH